MRYSLYGIRGQEQRLLQRAGSGGSGENAERNGRGDSGGGIFVNQDGTLTVSNSTFSGNSATNGRVIYNYNNEGTVTTLQNTIVANSPTGSNCSGTITNGGREPQLSRYGLPRHQRRSQTRVFAG